MPTNAPPIHAVAHADLAQSNLPAAERNELNKTDPSGTIAAAAAWREYSALLTGTKWSEKSTYDRINEICGGSRCGFSSADGWDGRYEKSPLKHPDFQKALLADTNLLNKTLTFAFNRGSEGHFVAQDVLQELLRGVMRDYTAVKFGYGTARLEIPKGEELGKLLDLTLKISEHLRFGSDGKLEENSAELALKRLGYDEWSMDGSLRGYQMRRSGKFEHPPTPALKFREELANAAGERLERSLRRPDESSKSREIASTMNFIRAMNGFNAGAFPALVGVIEKGSSAQAKTAAAVLIENGQLNVAEYRRLQGIASVAGKNPNRAVAQQTLAKIAAPRDEQLAINTSYRK